MLEKCLKILRADPQPIDIAYVTGILETLIEMQEPLARSSTVERPAVNGKVVGSTPTEPARDEASALDNVARAKFEEVKKMADSSTQT